MPAQTPPDPPQPPAAGPPERPAIDPAIRAEAEARAERRAEARRQARLGAAGPPPLPARPRFSQPVRQIVMMLLVLGLVGAGGAWAYGRIWDIFAASPWLNGVIGAVFVFGVLACLWQVGQLVRSVAWIERFAARRRTPETGRTEGVAPLLLAPLAALLGGRQAEAAISATAARGMLESVASRIDEARDITRYLANLLIFLGLLGTFYGLATTVPAVVETIRALAPQEGESALAVFDKLMTGLEGQLGGMATAFSSSLLGLAGSLVVGLLELFVTHGQNRFYRELEEWMTSFTSLALTPAEGDEAGGLAGLGAQLGQQLDAHLDRLAGFYAERDRLADLDQLAADERALLMARTVEDMAAQAQTDALARRQEEAARTDLIRKLVDGQKRLIAQDDERGPDPLLTEMRDLLARLLAVLARTDPRLDALERLAEGQERLIALAEISAEDRAGTAVELATAGDEVRGRLRSLDARLAQLADANAEARLAMQAELRADLAMLTRAVRRLGMGHGAATDGPEDG